MSYLKALPDLPAKGELNKKVSRAMKRGRAVRLSNCRGRPSIIYLARLLCLNYEGFRKIKVINDVARANNVLNNWHAALCDGKLIRVKSKIIKPEKVRLPDDKFYSSQPWRRARTAVLNKYGAECMTCGRSKKKHNIVVHVDHIKPRSTYPELELDENNLQILCEDCNLGKGNRDEIDWRP